jgi:hypothetical protein
MGHTGRAVAESHLVAGAVAADDRLAAGAVLRDLEQVELVGGERVLERGRQLVGEGRGRAGARRGAGDAVQRFRRGGSALACGGLQDDSAFPAQGVCGCIGARSGPLDGAGEPKRGNWTNQQAPGFCAQKSSNCDAPESAGGAVSLVDVSVPVLEEDVPPLDVSPVAVPVSPVVPPPVLVSPLLVELSVDVLLSVLVVLSDVLLSCEADAAASGAVSDTGTATSAGGPGTCGASASLPPQPAATTASRPAASTAARRGADIAFTPP